MGQKVHHPVTVMDIVSIRNIEPFKPGHLKGFFIKEGKFW